MLVLPVGEIVGLIANDQCPDIDFKTKGTAEIMFFIVFEFSDSRGSVAIRSFEPLIAEKAALLMHVCVLSTVVYTDADRLPLLWPQTC